MSQLIDEISKMNLCEIDFKWWIAKPLNYFQLIPRLKDAWRVFTGKSIAVHYKEDELSETERLLVQAKKLTNQR